MINHKPSRTARTYKLLALKSRDAWLLSKSTNQAPPPVKIVCVSRPVIEGRGRAKGRGDARYDATIDDRLQFRRAGHAIHIRPRDSRQPPVTVACKAARSSTRYVVQQIQEQCLCAAVEECSAVAPGVAVVDVVRIAAVRAAWTIRACPHRSGLLLPLQSRLVVDYRQSGVLETWQATTRVEGACARRASQCAERRCARRLRIACLAIRVAEFALFSSIEYAVSAKW